ncbi:response regulator [Rhodobacteraceae bacterium N5(2021)]|uniref:Response regulator n=1 Tax=Gymnodinialimonas phycosphaerae TaxID=2841589 RepID=A0A975TZC8_9RHOB|nr:response regulator [Gymnodinialimonas phycosphaerae]MBY4892857.1 response regulator [Gymnodinialimonas phycosphaerae]
MDPKDLSQQLAQELPFLRRYARALTGGQGTGDRYAVATLEAIVADPGIIDAAASARVGLFQTFHGIWISAGAPVPDADDESLDLLEGRAQSRLKQLTPNTREALLLHSIEGFGFDAISQIMQLPQSEVEQLYALAMADMGQMVTGDILIIEDEAIISMDLQSIVTDMGHNVTAIARTRDDAIAKGKAKVPDLILADIQLADRSSGIDAVNALLRELGDRPVIFITAFPEQLLTGERPEPAFLISKPYAEEQVRAAVSQAMFFATTEQMQVPA